MCQLRGRAEWAVLLLVRPAPVRTLWPLVSRPGWLTVEFLAGRRVRLIHPLKLYLAFSVLLFLVLAFTGYMAVRVSSNGAQTRAGIQVDTAIDEQEVNEETDGPRRHCNK